MSGQRIAADAFGNAVGSALADQSSRDSQQDAKLADDWRKQDMDRMQAEANGELSTSNQASTTGTVSSGSYYPSSTTAARIGMRTNGGNATYVEPMFVTNTVLPGPLSLDQIVAQQGAPIDYGNDAQGFRVSMPSSFVQALPVDTGSVAQADPGWWGDMQNIFHSNLPVSGKLGMAWDNSKHYFQISPRAQGVVQAGGGALEFAAGYGLSHTVVGATVGVPLAFHGGDNFGTGLSKVWNGEPQETVTYTSVNALTGSPSAARFVDQAISFAGGPAGAGAGADALLLSTTSRSTWISPVGRMSTMEVGEAAPFSADMQAGASIPKAEQLTVGIEADAAEQRYVAGGWEGPSREVNVAAMSPQESSVLLARGNAPESVVGPTIAVDKSLLPGGENFVGPLSPSELARSWQGSGAYPGIDTYTNVSLPKGTYVVGSAPGQSPYYTTLDGFAGMDGTAQDFYEKLQIGPNLTNPAHPPYRSGVTIYQVTGETQAASGTTLANTQFGPGGAPQLFIPDYKGSLTPVYSIPFKRP